MDIFDCCYSAFTYIAARHIGIHPAIPWFSLPAIRRLRTILKGRKLAVLEIGGGRSTLFLAKRCAVLHTIEEKREWVELLSSFAPKASIHHLSGEDALKFIDRLSPDSLDLVLIDGGPAIDRLECFRRVYPKLRTGGFCIVDDTDKHHVERGRMYKCDLYISQCSNFRSVRHVGWVPCSFCVHETTVCEKLK